MKKVPEEIILYGEGVDSQLLSSIAFYLRDRLKIKVKIEELHYRENSPYLLASFRIRNPQGLRFEPHPLEVELERKGIIGNSPPKGVIYDGWAFMRFLRSILPSCSLSKLQILISSRLLSTPEEGIHHIRTILLGYPSIISVSGLVEGPAKAKEFYLSRRLFGDELIGYQLLSENSYLKYNDPRLPLVLRGYVLQAFFYQAFGEPFCFDRGCCLYNAHWQKELIYAQLESPYELCPFHQQLLERWMISAEQ
ncbi:hypothetical protein H5T87_04130 [bacterium]|nr:hypothetical protein [bacterium]